MPNKFSRDGRDGRWMPPPDEPFDGDGDDEERFPKLPRRGSYWREDERSLGKAPPESSSMEPDDAYEPPPLRRIRLPDTFGPPILSVPEVRTPGEALWRFVGKILFRAAGKALSYALCVFFDTQPLGLPREGQGPKIPRDPQGPMRPNDEEMR